MGRNAVDQSAFRFGQLAFLPALNPRVGLVDLWFNDSPTTQLFNLQQLPAVERLADIQARHYTQLSNQPMSDDIAYLVKTLVQNLALMHIRSSPTPGDHGLNRKTIAAALQSIGASYADFARLDHVMKRPSSKTDSAKAWQHAAKSHISKHPGLLFKLLTPFQRKLCGIR